MLRSFLFSRLLKGVGVGLRKLNDIKLTWFIVTWHDIDWKKYKKIVFKNFIISQKVQTKSNRRSISYYEILYCELPYRLKIKSSKLNSIDIFKIININIIYFII